MLTSQILNAIMLGATFALIAIGFSLFFGVMNIVVFSAGDVAIVGAFGILGLTTMTSIQPALEAVLPVYLSSAIIVTIGGLITALVMLLMYFLVIKPFENKSELMPLLSTIAAGIALRELIGIFYPQGRNPHSFAELLPSGSITPNLALTWQNVIIVLGTVALVALLYWFINKTKLGLSIQAVSQNREGAMMLGLNWRRSIITTFLIGGFILGIAGFLVSSYNDIVRFDMGSMLGLKGFSAAVVGGLGGIYGAIIGGMLIAFVEVFVSAFISGGTAYANVAAFFIVVIFILFKPEGIIGEKSIDKV